MHQKVFKEGEKDLGIHLMKYRRKKGVHNEVRNKGSSLSLAGERVLILGSISYTDHFLHY